jgi:hypothetical protein
MSALKIKPNHGGRGPAPATFERWVSSASKRGAKRFRVHLGDSTTKLVAHKNAPDSARRMTAMSPLRVEALDEKEAELGEWVFPEAADDTVEEPAPGYLKEAGDTEDERLLKTFAHLLADAHRLASRQLVEVVSIQSKHFAEERKNYAALNLAHERLVQKRLRGVGFPRVRVAEGEEDEGDEAAEGGEDTFLRDLLAPYLQREITRHMGGESAAANGANGAAKEEKAS